MTTCIGRIAGQAGDWYAELDFLMARATVYERSGRGDNCEVCELELGAVETDPDCDALVDDKQNRRLTLIVFAPELKRLLDGIRSDFGELLAVENDIGEHDAGLRAMKLVRELYDIIDNTLNETLAVPKAGE